MDETMRPTRWDRALAAILAGAFRQFRDPVGPTEGDPPALHDLWVTFCKERDAHEWN